MYGAMMYGAMMYGAMMYAFTISFISNLAGRWFIWKQ